ncbi:MAG: rhamnulokinase [Bacteroidetes bacterium]|nr:MAG: rhamnulokinase [Bacteroidota bacterium]
MIASESTSYLAFDLGASTSRVFLGTLNGHTLEMNELHRFPTPVLERDDHLFWDLDAIWSELQIGLEKGLIAAPELRSISVDSWAVDYVSLDSLGKPVSDAYCYRDPRTTGVMERAFQTVSAKEIYGVTGIQFLPFNTLYQLMTEDQGETEAARTACLPIADYFNYRFSDVRSVEVSMASTTQMMDVYSRKWSASLLERFGLNPSRWPEIIPSGTHLGPAILAPQVTVIATCSHDTGCAVAATPVGQAASRYDAHSATLPAPNIGPAPNTGEKWAFISCGTWSCLGTEIHTPLMTDAAREAGFTNEAGLDGTIRLLKNLTGLWVLQECLREWRKSESLEWSDLESNGIIALRNAAGASDGTGSELAKTTRINLEDSRFLARGPMVDRLKKYCMEFGIKIPETRGEIVLEILSSIAESYSRTLIELESITDVRYKRIYLFGGGSQNTLLCQLTADTLNREVVAGPVEATAMGNLLIQARTMGDFSRGTGIRDIAVNSSDLNVYFPDSHSI